MVDSRVIEKLEACPLKNLDDVRRRFTGLPIEFAPVENHLDALRLLTTSSCRMRCQYPDQSGVLWCHDEGLVRDAVRPADMDTMLDIVTAFRTRYGTKQVNLAGLQPILNTRLLRFIDQLRSIGIEEVSLTSHGLRLTEWLPKLVDAGLTSLVLSIQGFSRESYRTIMGHEKLDNAISVVALARDLALPTAVNRVLVRGHEHDIPDMVSWARENKLRLRLYDLMWKPGQDNHFILFHIPWHQFTHLWEPDTERITVWTYTQPGRLNLVFWLAGGGSIETNVSVPSMMNQTPACASCRLREGCTEGWLGCGLRVTPDYKLQPCLWRPDLAMPLLPLLDTETAEATAARINTLARGDIPRHTR